MLCKLAFFSGSTIHKNCVCFLRAFETLNSIPRIIHIFVHNKLWLATIELNIINMTETNKGILDNCRTAIQQAYDTLNEVRDEEDEAYENLPESLQDGDRGDAMQEAIDTLDDAISSLDDVIGFLDDLDSIIA